MQFFTTPGGENTKLFFQPAHRYDPAMSDDKPDDDPLGLDHADCEIHIEKLRREIAEVAGDDMVNGSMGDCDPKVEEAFLEHVLALETHGFVCPFDALTSDGFELPSPKKLDDAALTAKLRELIHALAARRLFLHNTDHLSDRELYTWLWSDGLREEMMGFGLPMGNCHLDVLGACREEDIILQMRYYADEQERAHWAVDFPDFPMPPHEKPPFDRDRHLPQALF
ncbi:MAG: hypothetical protein ACLQAH_18860 [Limisphaerales bacterium]